jgi:RNA-splicing ligase RtcB
LDESNDVWVMLHSGSRNIGKTIGETAIHMARQIAEREERRLRDRDLAWLDEGSSEFDMYVEGLRWAQDYAAHNRALMMHAVLIALREEFGREIATFDNAVQCHHNYASVEEHFGQQVWVTRKGAVSARRRARDHSGLDGCQVVHRAREGQCGLVLLVLTWRGTSLVTWRREARVHDRRSQAPDRWCRVPQG